MTSLADTDVVALVRRRLMAHAGLTSEIGGEGRVGATNEPPYPRIRLSDPPGDDRGLSHLIAPTLMVEVLGDPEVDGQKPVLRRILYSALEVIAALPADQAGGAWPRVAGEPVVTQVVSAGGGGYVPEPVGAQPRYIATVRLYVHP